jgi:hypothetical protein
MVARSDLGRVRMETMRLGALVPAPYNPRSISPEALAGLGAWIRRFGWSSPASSTAAQGASSAVTSA